MKEGISVCRVGELGTSRASTAGTAIAPEALIYARLSAVFDEFGGYSLEVQLARCRDYARAQGCTRIHEYAEVKTGRREDRPRYQAMLSEARALRRDGRSVIVVTAALRDSGAAYWTRSIPGTS